MEIFYNQERPGYDEIVSYGPRWWTEYKEMDANYKFAGWTLDLMATMLERTVKNQFPSQADAKATGIYEKLLKIEYDDELSLEERRKIVSAYYSGTGHLSCSVILTMVKAYTGKDGEVYWDGDTLCICFNSGDGTMRISIDMLQKIVKRRVPAHIPFQTRIICPVQVQLGVSKEPWKVQYILTGTEPMVSTGLKFSELQTDVLTATEAYRNDYPMAGNSGNAGTCPLTNTGLGIGKGEADIQADASGIPVAYGMTGDDMKTGTEPSLSHGMGSEERSVLPETKTESWIVDYQLCGDFEL